jgi:trk/ktr system potassium uptake protein
MIRGVGGPRGQVEIQAVRRMKIIIVGAGEVGFHIANRLCAENKNVVVIDKSAASIRRVRERLDVQTIHGSGSNPLVLEEAGIKKADILLAVTDSDETNLVACLFTNFISPDTKKVARIREAAWDRYHEQFDINPPHIDSMINPDFEVVKTIERLLVMPGAVDVGEFENGRIKFVGIVLGKDSRLCGLKLSDMAKVLGEPPPLIASLVRGDELIIPTGKDCLKPNDLVYVIGKAASLVDQLKMFDKIEEDLKRVLIVGGGRIGHRLAKRLEEKSVHTKIIERDRDRCSVLAESLEKAVVLCADGSDQSTLTAENIQNMNAVVSVTNDEETNILVSLLSKQRGVPKAITKVDRFSYFNLMSTIGIHRIVSPRLSAINSILQHIRKGKILSDITLKGEQAEVIEAVAMETSGIVGKPLKKISFPKDALLTSIVRKQEIIIPSGNSIVNPGDRIIIFAKRQAIPKIEKFLTVKLDSL